MGKWIAIGAIIIAGFISCTTVPYSQQDFKVKEVVELINEGRSERLIQLSKLPFLFDGEILLRERDVATLWNNLAESGFQMKDVQIGEPVPAGKDDYPPFADTMEVRTFFKKYITEDASIVKINASNGEFYLLLGDKLDDMPKIIGYRMKI
ncbi:MAG: hypothetical protein K9L68_06215 [Spirochaetales bacterium]|nr:hypothetical protein [Spirochaetales bacterium]MCF7938176.1 hypothetical protein [Spirochaetales bacterium]